MKVFLSYTSEDRDYAKSLYSQLVQAGFEVQDPQASSLPGDNVGKQIGAALENSDAMVVVVTPQSQKSSSVTSEIQFALGSSRYKDRLIPVLVEGSIEAPWSDYVQVIKAAGKTANHVGRMVVDVLKKNES